jgi:hypothetical protein
MMKIRFGRIALIISFLAVLLVSIPVARAEESYVVYTEKDVYLIGETVQVFAKAEQIDADSTITIENVTVYDPMNQTIVTWSDLNIVPADTNTIVQVGELTATIEGRHAVYAEATGCPIRIIRWFFFIIRKILGFVDFASNR